MQLQSVQFQQKFMLYFTYIFNNDDDCCQGMSGCSCNHQIAYNPYFYLNTFLTWLKITMSKGSSSESICKLVIYHDAQPQQQT